MGANAALARIPSTGGEATIDTTWLPHPFKREADGSPVRAGIGNQRYFVETDLLPHKYRAFIGGIGSGKTISGAKLYLDTCIENAGGTSIICARDLPQVKKSQLQVLEQLFAEYAEHNGFPIVQSHNRSDHFFTLVNGHKCFYMGTKYADAIRGITASVIWWDEPNASENPNYVFKVLRGRLRQIGPGITRRLFILTGTPDGLQGPMVHWVNRCKLEIAPGIFIGRGKFAQWLMVKMRTADNDAQPLDYESDARADYDPKFAAQELDAEFVDLEGKVFSDVYRHDNYPLGNLTRNFRFDPKMHELHVAIDWGLVYPHVLWIAHIPDLVDSYQPCDVVIDELCEDGILVDDVIDTLKQKEKEWGRKYDAFYPDPSGRAENRLLRMQFKGSDLLMHSKRSLRAIRWGVFIMRSRLRNAANARRFLISDRVAKMPQNSHPEGRGICNGLKFYDYSRSRDGKARDDFKDDSWYVHAVDTARYYLAFKYRLGGDNITII